MFGELDSDCISIQKYLQQNVFFTATANMLNVL